MKGKPEAHSEPRQPSKMGNVVQDMGQSIQEWTNGLLSIFWRLYSTNFTWSILEYFVPYYTNFSTVTMDCFHVPFNLPVFIHFKTMFQSISLRIVSKFRFKYYTKLSELISSPPEIIRKPGFLMIYRGIEVKWFA